jgi:hypothetical protein
MTPSDLLMATEAAGLSPALDAREQSFTPLKNCPVSLSSSRARYAGGIPKPSKWRWRPMRNREHG